LRWIDRCSGLWRFFPVIAVSSTLVHGEGFDHWLASRLSSHLPVVERRLAEISKEMEGMPVLPDLDSLGTHGFHSNFTGGSEENWFEIAWDGSPLKAEKHRTTDFPPACGSRR
jgi:hypothetical protein